MAGYGGNEGSRPPHGVHTSPLYNHNDGDGHDGGEAPYTTTTGLFHRGAIRSELHDFYQGAAAFFSHEDDDSDRDDDQGDADDIPEGPFGRWASRVVYLVDMNAGKVKNQALVRPHPPTLLAPPPS
jgi:hypothetical protein